MTRTIVRLALVLAAALATPLAAQPGREGDDAVILRQEDAARRPFDALLRHRTELRLSREQVQRIEVIGHQLEERNAPLRRRLVAEHDRWRQERRAQLERMTPEQRRRELRRLREERARAPQVPEPLRPTVREMSVNIEEAIHQAQGVLTADQRLRARHILRREMGQQRGRAREMMERRRQERRRP